jgi:hypothetical protein
MKWLVTLGFIYCVVAASAWTQVHTTIGDYAEVTEVGNLHVYRPFVGVFEFEALPQPLTSTVVDFQLVATSLANPNATGEWSIRVHKSDESGVRLMSDTVFTCSAPH